MGYEIDFLAVGDGKKSGDAIAFRYGNLQGPRSEQFVMTIDGGTLESGDALVQHVKTHFGTNTVDLALLTHPDKDHASGMRRVMEGLTVNQVAMHLPWAHSTDIKNLVDDGRVTTNSLRERAKSNLKAAKEIEDFAKEKGIKIVEPFSGSSTADGVITVLGPTKDFYQQNLANFKFMPGTELGESVTSFASLLKKVGEKILSFVPESWWEEKLGEPAEDATSPENNSSVILLIQTDNQKILLTGDAGVPALTAAADYADSKKISLNGITLFQVPHHGSRKNLGPTILDRIFGIARTTDSKEWSACVSSAKDGEPKHPHKKVANALRRRGAVVKKTGGGGILYSSNSRSGWTTKEPLPFYTQVEDDD